MTDRKHNVCAHCNIFVDEAGTVGWCVRGEWDLHEGNGTYRGGTGVIQMTYRLDPIVIQGWFSGYEDYMWHPQLRTRALSLEAT